MCEASHWLSPPLSLSDPEFLVSQNFAITKIWLFAPNSLA